MPTLKEEEHLSRSGSFQKLSTLQKTNQILEHLIYYFEHNPPLLDSQMLKATSNINSGLLDNLMKEGNTPVIPNKPEEMLEVLRQIFLLKSNKANKKESSWDPIRLSEMGTKTISVLQRSKIHDKDVNVDDIIKKLLKNELIDEAKLLHDIFYLGYLILSKNKDNTHYKAIFSSVTHMMEPWLIKLVAKNDKEEKHFLTEKSVNAVFCSNIMHNLQNAMNHTNKLDHSFKNAYPSPQEMRPERENSALSSQETKKMSIDSSWTGKIWAMFRKLCQCAYKRNKGNAVS